MLPSGTLESYMKKRYRRLSRLFKDILGSEYFLTDPADTACYSFDASGQENMPWAVALPANTLQVSRTVELASREAVPVVPRGAGSGTTGASVPVSDSLVISLTRMKRIKSIDPVELSCVVEPGVITGDLQRAVEKQGLFYPPDPASLSFCTIGGNVNTCAGGARAVKYGVTRDYVRSLQVVLADGRVIRAGSSTAKGVVGYDLRHLFVGAEGTLGIVTEITLRLLPLPEAVGTVAAVFSSSNAAMDAVTCLFKSGILPRCAEFMDEMSLKCIRDMLPFDAGSRAKAFLLVEVDGLESSIASQLEKVRRCIVAKGAEKIYQPPGSRELNMLWSARRGLSPSIKKLGFEVKISEDICVPRSRLSSMLDFLKDAGQIFPVTILTFGHAGDGNLHVNLLFNRKELNSDKEIHELIKSIMKRTIELGGTISGEHGIGLSKKPFIHLELKPEVLDLHRQIKKILDPGNILNPHKIF